MAYPTIVFNNSTGSDTAASGAGPTTALTGTAASYTGSVVTLDGSPDLTNVATDGSHVLYLVTSTGRKFFTINAKDNTAKTVTTDDAPAGTASGLSWAIGGKRATFDETNSRLLFSQDYKANWVVETETDQTITASVISIREPGTNFEDVFTVRGTTEHKVINQTGNVGCFDTAWAGRVTVIFENLKFTNSHASHGGYAFHNINGGKSVFRNCVIGDATNYLNHGLGNTSDGLHVLIDCEVAYCSGDGLTGSSWGHGEYHLYGCWVHDNTGRGIKCHGRFCCEDTVVSDNGSDGIYLDLSVVHAIIRNCTISGNTGDGIEFVSAVNTSQAIIYNNNVTSNGGYGIRAAASTSANYCEDYNNFGTGGTANTSGAVLNITQGDNDIAVDPGYVSAGGNNYGVGTNVKAEGFPDAARNIGANQSATVSRVDIGASQRQEPAGGIPNTTKIFTNIGTY